MQRNATVLGLLLGSVCLLTAQSDPPAKRFAGEIQRYREWASSARDFLVGLMAELKEVHAFYKVDGPLITTNLEAVARTWSEAAAALEKGDETAAAALAQRAQELAGQRDRWRERIQWRARQAQNGEYLPATAEIFLLLATDRNEEDVKQIEAYLEAKKRRSEAYGRLAEATTPTAEAETLFKVQEEVYAADVEVGVAEMKYTWGEEDLAFRRWIATDSTITSPELTAAKQRLADWRHERENLYRQSRSQQHALDKLDLEHNALVAAREKAYRAAKAARESLQKGK